MKLRPSSGTNRRGTNPFSDIEDGGSDGDSASYFSAPPASAHGAGMIPTATAPPAAGHLSSFFLRTRRRAHHLQMAEAEAAALAPSEPITTVSDGRALSADGWSHQGSDPAPAADSHQGVRAGAHAHAPRRNLPSPDAPAPKKRKK